MASTALATGSTLPMLGPRPSTSDLIRHLKEIQSNLPANSTIAILPAVYCFKDAAQKSSTIPFDKSLKDRRNISHFLSTRIPKGAVRVALWTSMTETWVGKPKLERDRLQRDQLGLHDWVCCVLPGEPHGKTIVFWDSWAEERLRKDPVGLSATKILLPRQLQVFDRARKIGLSVAGGIWHGASPNTNLDSSVPPSLQWLKDVLGTRMELKRDHLAELGFQQLNI